MLRDDGERSVIADNILDQDFAADRQNQKLLADFTYIWTSLGWLYVAVVLDLFFRRVVGWSMKADKDAALVVDALMMAVWGRYFYRTRDEACADVFDEIERFSNPRRRHSKLGYLSTVAFEARAMLA